MYCYNQIYGVADVIVFKEKKKAQNKGATLVRNKPYYELKKWNDFWVLFHFSSYP
jgi:hypothetical protein